MERGIERVVVMRIIGEELAREVSAIAERRKRYMARSVEKVVARISRRAPPWPTREESDRLFREAWLALERDAAFPQQGWEPEAPKSRVEQFLDEPFDGESEESGVSPAPVCPLDRAVLAAWLRAGDPMARMVLDWVRASRSPRVKLLDREASVELGGARLAPQSTRRWLTTATHNSMSHGTSFLTRTRDITYVIVCALNVRTHYK